MRRFDRAAEQLAELAFRVLEHVIRRASFSALTATWMSSDPVT
jgi:hypothetical protein